MNMHHVNGEELTNNPLIPIAVSEQDILIAVSADLACVIAVQIKGRQQEGSRAKTESGSAALGLMLDNMLHTIGSTINRQVSGTLNP